VTISSAAGNSSSSSTPGRARTGAIQHGVPTNVSRFSARAPPSIIHPDTPKSAMRTCARSPR
jgi:hypothetical protein